MHFLTVKNIFHLPLLLAIYFQCLSPLPCLAFSPACQPPPSEEQQIWDSISQSTDPKIFLSYLQQYPQGCFRAVANFKIKALVDENLKLRVYGIFSNGSSLERKEGEWLEGRMVEQFDISATAMDPVRLRLEFQCDAAGRGLSGWIGDRGCHPGGRAPIQGFAVRMVGSYTDFYDLAVDCVTTGPGGDKPQSVGNEGWCGVRGGTPKRYIYKLMIQAKRKPFNS